MIGLLLGLFAAVIIAALILGSLAVYGSKASHMTRVPATVVVAGDNLPPSPINTTRILNVSGAWGYVKPWIKWLTIITIVTLVAFAFMKWVVPNIPDVTAITPSVDTYFNLSNPFIEESTLIGMVAAAVVVASIILLYKNVGSVMIVFIRDIIFTVIIVAMNYALYHYQLLETPVFWLVIAVQLLVLSLISRNLRFRLVMLFAFLIFVAVFFDKGIEHGLDWLDRRVNHGEWAAPVLQTRQRPVTNQTSVIIASNSGQIIAPVSNYSVWLKIPTGKCIHWWTNEPENNDVRTKYVNAAGEEWRSLRQEEPAQAQAWKSNLTRRIHVYYETVGQRPDGSCPRF